MFSAFANQNKIGYENLKQFKGGTQHPLILGVEGLPYFSNMKSLTEIEDYNSIFSVVLCLLSIYADANFLF